MGAPSFPSSKKDGAADADIDRGAWLQMRAEVTGAEPGWFKLGTSLSGYYLMTAAHVCSALLMVYSSRAGFIPVPVLRNWIAAAVISDALLYLVLRSGYNLRFRDPTLVVPRTLQYTALMLYAMVYAGPTKICCVLGIVAGFVYAGLMAPIRTMLRLSLLTILAYAATLPLIAHIEGAHFNLKLELLSLMTFAAALPSIAVGAGMISELRYRLALSNDKLKEALEQVTTLATTDELTETYNRRSISHLMDYEIRRIDGSGATFSVCMFDIDHFKRINDSHGHHVGDVVLQAFSRMAASVSRQGDLFARWGGEEFLLFMPQTSLPTARIAAERIRREFAALSLAELPTGYSLSVSAGIAEYDPRETLAQVIARADQALYCAKAAGRNRVEAAPPDLVEPG